MTQKELAEKAGITESAVSRYIKEERVPRSVTVAAIAKALDVPVSELLEEANNCEEDLDDAVRLIARNAGSLTEQQKMKIFSAVAKL
jgi:transcriptional regulator with XRE-family HTH domain